MPAPFDIEPVRDLVRFIDAPPGDPEQDRQRLLHLIDRLLVLGSDPKADLLLSDEEYQAPERRPTRKHKSIGKRFPFLGYYTDIVVDEEEFMAALEDSRQLAVGDAVDDVVDITKVLDNVMELAQDRSHTVAGDYFIIEFRTHLARRARALQHYLVELSL